MTTPIIIRMEQSDALFDGDCPQCNSDSGPTIITLGPFEWVELTYRALRVSPEGTTIAFMNEQGVWESSADGRHFSDLLFETA